MISPLLGALPAFREFGVGLSVLRRMEFAKGEVRRGDGDLRHSGDVADRDADRRSGRPWHRRFPAPSFAGLPLRRPIGVAIELLAGIPSIIYGIWGVYYFRPVMQAYIQPFLISTLGNVPIIGYLFQGPPLGYGVLTAGLVLALMILPFITAVSRDVFETVPPVLKEARLRRRRDDLRGGRKHRHSLYPCRRHRRGHAGARPRARRDDGGHFRRRQRHQDLDFDPRPGDDHLGDDRQPVRRRRSGTVHLRPCSRSASSCS